jgi:membrane protease YdiL (CAAX protease family)
MKRQMAMRQFGWLLWVLLVVAGVFAARYVVAAGTLLLRLMGPDLLNSPSAEYVLRTVALGVSFLLGVGIPYIMLGLRTSRSELGIARLPAWKDIGLGVGGVVVYGVAAMILLAAASALSLIDVTQTQTIGNTAIYGTDRLVAFIMLVVVVPLVEELLFRGFLYGKLRSMRVPFWLVAVVVSAVFGVLHGQWNVAIDVFCLSMVAAYLREQTGTIWPGFIIHMIKNLIAFYYGFMAA